MGEKKCYEEDYNNPSVMIICVWGYGYYRQCYDNMCLGFRVIIDNVMVICVWEKNYYCNIMIICVWEKSYNCLNFGVMRDKVKRCFLKIK